ncbi:hypothetical protein BCR39DRAFT_107469 [Naematelia encephala]|uniref:Uncharacterized protein n=1 Tax=Naematelia encephala TaxID=71784 RepID=A0A1Y2B8L6_9TREE|nr:hypothetical protein BCR39DRAFT_107469 [Naematelia encephala]
MDEMIKKHLWSAIKLDGRLSSRGSYGVQYHAKMLMKKGLGKQVEMSEDSMMIDIDPVNWDVGYRMFDIYVVISKQETNKERREIKIYCTYTVLQCRYITCSD